MPVKDKGKEEHITQVFKDKFVEEEQKEEEEFYKDSEANQAYGYNPPNPVPQADAERN